jgi:hypothetical protein
VTGFYRVLGLPGRCMFWGMAFTILFIVAGFVTGIGEFYVAAFVAFLLSGISAAIAA